MSAAAAIDRLAANSCPEPNTGCLLWTKYATQFGYGQIGVSGAVVYTHRLAWELARGPIPDGMSVCHKCDTPACVNVSHLFLGDCMANMTDMVRKGRNQKKLSAADVLSIRERAEAGETQWSIAKSFGITQAGVWMIINRKNWRHV